MSFLRRKKREGYSEKELDRIAGRGRPDKHLPFFTRDAVKQAFMDAGLTEEEATKEMLARFPIID